MRSVLIRNAEPGDARILADLAYRSWEKGILPLLTETPGLRDAEQHRSRRDPDGRRGHLDARQNGPQRDPKWTCGRGE